MENKTMLERLENILKAKEENKQKMLKNLINDLILDVANEKASHNANYDIVKTINKQLQEIKKKCKSRPILANSVIVDYKKDKYLSYTDSFYLVMLKYQDVFTNVINPQKELLKTITYPNILSLIPNYYDRYITSFDKKDLLSKSMLFKQSQKNHTMKYDEESGIMENRDQMLVKINNTYVDASYVIKVCDVIGYDNLTVEYSDNGLKPLVLRSDLGFGLVLPLRTIKNI